MGKLKIKVEHQPENWLEKWIVEAEEELSDGSDVSCELALKKGKRTGKYLLTIKYISPSRRLSQNLIVSLRSEVREGIDRLLFWLQNELYGPSNLSQNNLVINRSYNAALSCEL